MVLQKESECMTKKTRLPAEVDRSLLMRKWNAIPLWARMALGAGVSLLILFGAGRFAAGYVAECEQLTFDVLGVEVKTLPSWFDGRVENQLLHPEVDGIPGRVSVLDRDLLKKLAVYYERHPWIDAVEKIEYIFPGETKPGRIAARIQLKKPLAAVKMRQTGSCYLVGVRGERLGFARDSSIAKELRLPVICFADRAPAAPGGAKWEEKIMHGFYLATLLNQEGLRAGFPHWIVMIDVQNVGDPGRCEVVLLTEESVEIRWGRTPRAEYHGRSQLRNSADKVRDLKVILGIPGALPNTLAFELYQDSCTRRLAQLEH